MLKENAHYALNYAHDFTNYAHQNNIVINDIDRVKEGIIMIY